MARTLGWDVGGAHLKAALAENGRILKVWQEPSPIWQGLHHLDTALEAILSSVDQIDAVERHAITMTGELSDIFASRREGVEQLTRIFTQGLEGDVSLYAGTEGFVSPGDARSHADAIASANWHASAALAAGEIEEALFLDMGSTTTDPRARRRETGARQGCHRPPAAGRRRTRLSGLHPNGADGRREARALRRPLDPGDERVFRHHGRRAAHHRRSRRRRRPAPSGRWRRKDRRGLSATARPDDRHGTLRVRPTAPGSGSPMPSPRRRCAISTDAALQVLSREDLTDEAPVVVAGAGRSVLRRLAARLDRGVVDFSDLFDCPRRHARRCLPCGPRRSAGDHFGALTIPFEPRVRRTP